MRLWIAFALALAAPGVLLAQGASSTNCRVEFPGTPSARLHCDTESVPTWGSDNPGLGAVSGLAQGLEAGQEEAQSASGAEADAEEQAAARLWLAQRDQILVQREQIARLQQALAEEREEIADLKALGATESAEIGQLRTWIAQALAREKTAALAARVAARAKHLSAEHASPAARRLAALGPQP